MVNSIGVNTPSPKNEALPLTPFSIESHCPKEKDELSINNKKKNVNFFMIV
jgi:hypothetical protein